MGGKCKFLTYVGGFPLKDNQNETKPQKSKKKLSVILIAVFAALAIIGLLVFLFWPNIKVMFTVLKLKNADVGETFTLGTYEQDGNTSNGAEEVEWILLAKEGDKALVISKYALDCIPYNSDFESSSWETCTLRTWLNDDFYNTTFSKAEKRAIAITTVSADANPKFGTDPGKDTQDPMFLLSVNETEKYVSDRDYLKCKPTKYATYGQIETSKAGHCKWWLRSPGLNPSDATAVGFWGYVYGQGNYVFFQFYGVRPAMWIDLK